MGTIALTALAVIGMIVLIIVGGILLIVGTLCLIFLTKIGRAFLLAKIIEKVINLICERIFKKKVSVKMEA